ncbi:hypothetical protein Tco_0686396 [Tanacetum coccineum]
MDNVPKIFKIKGNMFDFETPLCKAFYEFNYLLKIDTDLFTYDIQNFKTYDEYERELNNDIAKGTEELWSENGVPYQLCDHICEPCRFKNEETKWPTCTSDIDGWYDELADGKLKDETLALNAKIKGSWGDATPVVMKFCKWLKNNFENFYELDYDVLVKLQECWWKVNAHEITPFTRMENFERGPYANMKMNGLVILILTSTVYLEGIMKFEMMKYSFDDDEEYITIKESEYLNHSKDSLDAYR